MTESPAGTPKNQSTRPPVNSPLFYRIYIPHLFGLPPKKKKHQNRHDECYTLFACAPARLPSPVRARPTRRCSHVNVDVLCLFALTPHRLGWTRTSPIHSPLIIIIASSSIHTHKHTHTTKRIVPPFMTPRRSSIARRYICVVISSPAISVNTLRGAATVVIAAAGAHRRICVTG